MHPYQITDLQTDWCWLYNFGFWCSFNWQFILLFCLFCFLHCCWVLLLRNAALLNCFLDLKLFLLVHIAIYLHLFLGTSSVHSSFTFAALGVGIYTFQFVTFNVFFLCFFGFGDGPFVITLLLYLLVIYGMALVL